VNTSSNEPLSTNPYLAQQQADSQDLDAAAPVLQSTESRRLNRRAVAFVSLAVALVAGLVWTGVVMLGNRNEAPAQKPREEIVTVPDLPNGPSESPKAAPANPVPLVDAARPFPPPNGPPMEFTALPEEAPRGPTLMERRMMAAGSHAPTAESPTAAAQMLAAAPGQLPGATPPRGLHLPDVSSAQPLNTPDTLLLRGTFIRCVLETRIVTDLPGFTSCVVTEPVYAVNGRRLLLPKGSKVLGKYEREANGPRVAVIWDRIVTPNGIDVNMASPGVDNLGGSGHPGHYSAHWGSRIGAALLISMLSDGFKYAAAEHGPQTTTITNGLITQQPFESNTARSMERLAQQALNRQANRPATVTINQGTLLNVYVAKDVDFSGVLAKY
jgi:type IV secretion system protein VirB10